MSDNTNKILRWAPRVLAILYALFISLFALDVWGMEGAFWEKLGGFLIHLIPTYFVIAGILLGWRWPLIGGITFVVLALAYSLFFNWAEDPLTLLLMAGPLLLIGVLFLLDGWIHREQLQPRF